MVLACYSAMLQPMGLSHKLKCAILLKSVFAVPQHLIFHWLCQIKIVVGIRYPLYWKY